MTPFEIQKAKIDATFGRVENDILKGGEGSKGGKVIGHTRSGKAIYDKFNHASHSNFSHQDHADAEAVHGKHQDSENAKKAFKEAKPIDFDKPVVNHDKNFENFKNELTGKYGENYKRSDLSEDDADKLFDLKEKRNEGKMSANQFTNKNFYR